MVETSHKSVTRLLWNIFVAAFSFCPAINSLDVWQSYYLWGDYEVNHAFILTSAISLIVNRSIFKIHIQTKSLCRVKMLAVCCQQFCLIVAVATTVLILLGRRPFEGPTDILKLSC